MQLRDYQKRAVESTTEGWKLWKRQLGIMGTGGGKTVCFSHLAARETGRTLILAHREELVAQAVAKLHAATGIAASVEQGASRAMPGHGVIVGSVQSVRRRLAKYAPDAFDLVICDEAHHALSSEWQAVLSHFEPARVLGVTATPDRSDRRSLGRYFQNVAFEIGLMELIGSGHLCGLRALRLDVQLDAKHLKLKGRGDLSADSAAELISPQLDELAKSVASEIWDRNTLVFLPRCDVSQAFADALGRNGIEARHVSGESDDADEVKAWASEGKRGRAVCNAMLWTEGVDIPAIDCVTVLRPTRSRALYCQMVGRGTRLAPGKEHCLLIDPLWLCGDIDLCRPADLVADNDLLREKLQARIDEGNDLAGAETIARADVEEALAEKLREAQKVKKVPRGLVDPLTWAIGIHDSNLETYEPAMPWEEEPATPHQMSVLDHWGVWTESMTRGYAVKLLERIEYRDKLGLATPKQVMLLRRMGEANADMMTKSQAGYALGQRLRRAA